MRERHPFAVLSEQEFNDRTSLVIGLPMTTADYNADNPFAVPAGEVRLGRRRATSYVLCHQPKSFDWRARSAAPHPLMRLSDAAFGEACSILDQILRLR